MVMAVQMDGVQFFTLTIMGDFVWENYWGVEKLGTATGAVTSGVGVYGPPLRLLSNSEVMVLNVRFEDGR